VQKVITAKQARPVHFEMAPGLEFVDPAIVFASRVDKEGPVSLRLVDLERNDMAAGATGTQAFLRAWVS
jgi:hypothetical protein